MGLCIKRSTMNTTHVLNSPSIKGFRSLSFNFSKLQVLLWTLISFGFFELILWGFWERDFTLYSMVKPAPVYGPHFETNRRSKPYAFNDVYRSFGGVSLNRLNELHPEELEAQIIFSAPRNIRHKVRRYLPSALKLAEHYQVDPFWVLAVIYTESHFNPNARSYVNAIGLMQVMPGTSHFLSHRMGIPMSPKLAYKMARDPNLNMRMGVFYLKTLLKEFKGSYRLATVAYNMGPGNVRNRLRMKLPVGKNHLYLKKVQRAYIRMSRLTRMDLYKRPLPYQLTYVWPGTALIENDRYDLLVWFKDFEADIDSAHLSYEPYPMGSTRIL